MPITLTKENAGELLPLLKAEAERRRATDRDQNKIRGYFLEEGEFRRELYGKQMEFFGAGGKYKERMFMAANRCLAPWSVLGTGVGERRIGELIGEGGFDVQSWDGGDRCIRRAHPVFLRGIGRAYRLHLDNGATLDCSGRHLVLTTEGWVSIEQLILRGGGLRLMRAGVDYQANCGTGGRLGDRQLPCESDSAGGELPREGGVLGPGRPDCSGDGVVPKFGHSRAYQEIFLDSRWDDPTQISDLCEKFEDPTCSIDAVWRSGLRREFEQYQPESFLRREAPEGELDRCERIGRAFLECEAFSALLCLSHIPLVGGNHIVSIVPLGLQPILDFSVPGTHNYVSAGLVSHNCGKSDAGSFEVTCHATGDYPKWWIGRRFKGPTDIWACGTTGETTRDIVQEKLVGKVGHEGTGMIPSGSIVKLTARRGGIADALESIQVRHIKGGISTIGLKSYQQGRESFEGTAKQVIWLDEEPPEDVYTECLYRTATTKGILLVTFTPLQGMSDVVKGFLEPETDEASSYKWYIQAGWKDVPHISEDEKKALIATTPPYQIQARTNGDPALGAGAVYPIAEADITVPTTAVPANWPRVFAMDVGWKRTAGLWFAKNIGTGQVVVYSEYYQGQGEPESHAAGVKARGAWIPGVIDPACQGSSQVDGKRLIDIYRKLGLRLAPAENSVEAGLIAVWNLLVSGRLKVMDCCTNFFREFRQYHREEKHGHIVKEMDHLMDCMRYGVVSGFSKMITEPPAKSRVPEPPRNMDERSWMV